MTSHYYLYYVTVNAMQDPHALTFKKLQLL